VRFELYRIACPRVIGDRKQQHRNARPSEESPIPHPRNPARAAGPARHGRQDGHRVTVLDRRLQAAEEPDVLVVEVHVDEPAQPGPSQPGPTPVSTSDELADMVMDVIQHDGPAAPTTTPVPAPPH